MKDLKVREFRGYFVINGTRGGLPDKHGRSCGIRTHDPFTPSDVPEENVGNYR